MTTCISPLVFQQCTLQVAYSGARTPEVLSCYSTLQKIPSQAEFFIQNSFTTAVLLFSTDDVNTLAHCR